MVLNKTKYLSLMVLVGLAGCTTNQYVTRSGGGYDDLYGGNSGPAVVSSRDADEALSRSNNPDYQQSYANTQGTADYYDESYLAANSVKRAVSGDVGYNAGFADGYNQATRFSNPYGYNSGYGFNNYGSYFPGSGMGLNLMFGLGGGFRMSPYMSYGMGSMLSYGYSPYGYGSMMGMYDPWGYNSYGYSPYGYSPFGYGGYSMFNSYYGGGYYGGGYGGAVVVVNNYERPGLTRTFGPRVTSGGSSRRSDRYNDSFVNTPRTSNDAGRSGRRSAESISGADYSSPRSNRNVVNSSGRMSAESDGVTRNSSRTYSSNTGDANNTYYARPRSGNYSSAEGVNSGTYASPRASRSTSSYNSSGSAPAYSSPARSQSNYNTAPSRSSSSYSAPSRSSESYSSPSRSNNSYSSPAPTYSAPSRSYSAPASSGSSSGGGGGGGGSSRGPR